MELQRVLCFVWPINCEKNFLENVAAGVLKGIQDHIDQKIEINFAYTA